jgi:hypothetical protein
VKYFGRTDNLPEGALDGLRTLVVPSGIGEFQWAWTKYANAGERFAILGLDGAPRRLHQFAELHPAVEVFAYSNWDYSTIRRWMQEHGLQRWSDVTSQFELGSLCMLACNPHLESGAALADWLPDLPTTYRYPLATTDEHRRQADQVLAGAEPGDFLLGISCASYRGADAWRTWGAEQWTEFLHLIAQEVPNVRFALLGGAWDDLTSAVYNPESSLRWVVDRRGLPPVGTTHFGGAVEILKRLDGYVGFSSGLGHVAAHCCGTPVFMLWPEHEQALSTSWVDPELLENGFYVPSSWVEPKEVYKRAKLWLRRVVDGSYKR